MGWLGLGWHFRKPLIIGALILAVLAAASDSTPDVCTRPNDLDACTRSQVTEPGR